MLPQIQNILSGFKPPQGLPLGNSYLDTGGLNPNAGKGTWEDYIRQLGFSNVENITDFNSPLYQQYQQYLQKTSPQIGVNSLLAPLLAGGMSYAGGQNIASAKMNELNLQRQDKINTNVQGFAGSLQSQVMPQIGQVGNSFQNTMQRVSQEDMFNAQNSGVNAVMNTIGQFTGLLNPFNFGGGSYGGRAVPQQPSVAGYGG